MELVILGPIKHEINLNPQMLCGTASGWDSLSDGQALSLEIGLRLRLPRPPVPLPGTVKGKPV
jgi:hypothetical protein